MSQQLMQLMLHNISNKHNFTKFKHFATHKTVFSCVNFLFNRKFSDTFRSKIVTNFSTNFRGKMLHRVHLCSCSTQLKILELLAQVALCAFVNSRAGKHTHTNTRTHTHTRTQTHTHTLLKLRSRERERRSSN